MAEAMEHSKDNVMDYSDFRRFCLMQKQSCCHLPTGSAAELPLMYIGNNPTDIDGLLYCYDICALPWNRRPPKNFKGTVLRINSDHTPPGFAKLQTCERNCQDESAYYRRPRLLRDAHTGGPAVTEARKADPTAPFRDDDLRKKKSDYCDKVFAIYCPYWPNEAEEWRVRKRNHGWPSQRLINRIARGGCHFVSKLRIWSTCDDTESEWRFSFSKAELILIHNWTNVQKYVYHLVRVIKDDVAKRCDDDEQNAFQTYFFKTLMLWDCEEKPSEYWNENNVETCVRGILCRLVECLIDLQCPSYFIPEQNIMNHLSQKNREKELSIFVSYIEDISECIKNITSKFVFAKSYLVPNSLLTKTLWKAVGHAFPLKEDFECGLKHRLSDCEWFLPEMKYLHRAIEANLRLILSNPSVSSRRDSEYYSQCMENFNCAMTNYKWVEPLEQSDFNLSILENKIELLRRMPARFARNESRLRQKPGTKAKCSTHPTDCVVENGSPLDFFSNAQRLIDAFKKISSMKLPYKSPPHMNLLSDAVSKYVAEEYDAVSLPVPLFGVVTAYKANFYYTCMQSYSFAEKECKRYFKAYEDLKHADDDVFADVTPMLISTSLSPIYDEHVQAIFGFATLFKFCTATESDSAPCREVVLAVTHREFVRYMDVQCIRKSMDSSKYCLRSDFTIPKTCDCLQHNLSQIPHRLLFSVIFFYAALRQSRANVRLIYSEGCEIE